VPCVRARSPDGPVGVRLRVRALGAAEPAGLPGASRAGSHSAVVAPGGTGEVPGPPFLPGTAQGGNHVRDSRRVRHRCLVACGSARQPQPHCWSPSVMLTVRESATTGRYLSVDTEVVRVNREDVDRWLRIFVTPMGSPSNAPYRRVRMRASGTPTTGRVHDPRSAPAPGGRSPALEPSPATISTAPSPGPATG